MTLQRWCCERCGAVRDYAPGDELRYYRRGGPPCPRDERHGPMAHETREDDLMARVPVRPIIVQP